MKFRMNDRTGYTLVELTFSIALLTSITMMSLVAFVGILGVYNKAQSLTRTQEDSRASLDQLTRDLRQSYTVEYYATKNSSFTSGSVTKPNPITTAPSSLTTDNMKDFFCLRNQAGDFEVGYALVYRTSTQNFHLMRSTSCRDYSRAEQITSLDVWNDKGAQVVTGGWTRPATETSPPTDGSLDQTRAPITITQIPGTDPKVWYVRVTTYRGATLPTNTAFKLDRFGAQTTLDSIVTTRQ